MLLLLLVLLVEVWMCRLAWFVWRWRRCRKEEDEAAILVDCFVVFLRRVLDFGGFVVCGCRGASAAATTDVGCCCFCCVAVAGSVSTLEGVCLLDLRAQIAATKNRRPQEQQFCLSGAKKRDETGQDRTGQARKPSAQNGGGVCY